VPQGPGFFYAWISARSWLVLRVRRQWPFHSGLRLQRLRRVAVPGLAVQRLAAGPLGLVETLAGADAGGRYFLQFGVGSRFDGAPPPGPSCARTTPPFILRPVLHRA